MSVFSEYVTSTAFSLSLSRRQIEMLCQLDAWGSSYGIMSTCCALIAKGLAERVAGDAAYVRLTDAGRAVIPLLKLAGLFIQYEPIPPAVSIPPAPVRVKEPA